MKFKFVTVFVLLIIQSNFIYCQQSNSPLPNIVCIFVDDLGYGDLSYQGAKDLYTPNIDGIAKGGITFTNFYANSTVCSPSRASLLTGKYPDRVGVPGVIRQNIKNSWGYLDTNTELLPQVLKEKNRAHCENDP